MEEMEWLISPNLERKFKFLLGRIKGNPKFWSGPIPWLNQELNFGMPRNNSVRSEFPNSKEIIKNWPSLVNGIKKS